MLEDFLYNTLSFDTILRLQAFLILLLCLVTFEIIVPRRKEIGRKLRWPNNWGIFLLNAIVLLALPLSSIGASFISISYKIGLFFWVEFPFWPKVIICMLILDLAIYWQHRLFHSISVFWKIHRVHHTDINFDVTTALRFHPIEIVVSILIKMTVIVALGAPLLAVLLFEIILNGMAMFNHSNLRIPRFLDTVIRKFLVTPDMHRVHHSVHVEEHNRNYGFCLSLWDHLFRSYKAQPKEGHQNMKVGLSKYNTASDQNLFKLLLQPFK